MARKHRPRQLQEGIRTKKPPKDFDPNESKIRAIREWEDVADEVDAFHISRDKVLLEDDDVRDEEDISSEEEVLAVTSEGDGGSDSSHNNNGKSGPDSEDDDDEEGASDEEDGLEHWGSNKKAYYGGKDVIETQQDALYEEAEARRIQMKQLAAMSEADFLLDEDEWKVSVAYEKGKEKDKETPSGRAITEALPVVDLEALSSEECLKLLKIRNPEFEPLSNEFMELQNVFTALSASAEAAEVAGDLSAIAIAKFRALSAYLGVLGMYFAVLTSPSDSGTNKVKEHGVMEGLVKCRRVWSHVKHLEPDNLSKNIEDNVTLKSSKRQQENDSDILMSEREGTTLNNIKPHQRSKFDSHLPFPGPGRKRLRLDSSIGEPLTTRAQKLAETESSLADLADLTKSFTSRKTNIVTTTKSILKNGATTIASRSPCPSSSNSKSKPPAPLVSFLDVSDFGESTHLSTADAQDKATRRRTLHFYTAQITSKSAKRSRVSQASSGDVDLPYKEHNKDRSERLNNEAVKRGSAPGYELDKDVDLPDSKSKENEKETDSDEDYYQSIALASKHRKEQKKAVHDAVREAEKKGLQFSIIEGTMGPDGKRGIGYAIEKNKGLTPHRKKEVRNPRVKKRVKYEEAKKKLKSKKAIYKPLEGAYGGEATGIKKSLVKSVKLS